jgi:O-antigen ligase
MCEHCHSEYFLFSFGDQRTVTAQTTLTPLQPAPARNLLESLAPAAAATLVLVAIVAPRSLATLLVLPIAVAAGLLVRQHGLRDVRMSLNGLLAGILLFAAYAGLSALWSAAPLATLGKSLYLLGITAGIGVFAAILPDARTGTLSGLARGTLIGLTIGAALLCIETVSDQGITRFFLNAMPSLRLGQEKHLVFANDVVVTVAENEINRRATIVTMLLLPALLMVKTFLEDRARLLGTMAILAIPAVLMGFSGHQSSQAAIAVAATGFGLTLLSPVWTRRLVGLTWVVCCLLVVPIVIGLHGTGMHTDSHALFNSARHRIVIWNYTAEQVAKAPILGIGADATATMTEARDRELRKAGAEPPKDGNYGMTAARHAHNVFLQVWYELGRRAAVCGRRARGAGADRPPTGGAAAVSARAIRGGGRNDCVQLQHLAAVVPGRDRARRPCNAHRRGRAGTG